MKNNQWKYRVGSNFTGVILSSVLLGIFSGFTFFLYKTGNDAVAVGMFMTGVMIFVTLLAFVGKFYRYSEIRNVWVSSGERFSKNEYFNYETLDGNIVKMILMPSDEEAVEFMLTHIKKNSTENLKQDVYTNQRGYEINVLKERIEAVSGKKVKTGSSRKTNRKQSKLVQGIMVLVGIVFVCASISFMFQSVKNYKNQLEQRDWQITTAKVTYVDERIESSGTRRHRSSHAVYNIDYQYEVDGNIYANNIYRTRIKKEYGEVFQIKYDTESPKDSTHILEPDLGSLVIGLVMESLFGLMGIRVLRMSLYKKNKKRS